MTCLVCAFLEKCQFLFYFIFLIKIKSSFTTKTIRTIRIKFPMRKCLNTHGVSSNPGLWDFFFKGTCELMVFVENALLIFYIELRKRFPPQNIQ